MEKSYKIVGRTNGWIAQRDIHFGGKTEITLDSCLTLREAQKKLLDFFNEDYSTYYDNWGLARCNHRYETTSHKDGTRSYEYDSRYYSIEEEDRWYSSSYDAVDADVDPDCDYFIAESDEAAVEHAKELAKNGVDYVGLGHVELELHSVCRVDPSREYEEIKTIWY